MGAPPKPGLRTHQSHADRLLSDWHGSCSAQPINLTSTGPDHLTTQKQGRLDKVQTHQGARFAVVGPGLVWTLSNHRWIDDEDWMNQDSGDQAAKRDMT